MYFSVLNGEIELTKKNFLTYWLFLVFLRKFFYSKSFTLVTPTGRGAKLSTSDLPNLAFKLLKLLVNSLTY